MKLSLAENIRACRKQRRMTQEQLAEVLGVTTGAVYKWENGLSIPELDLIVEMADFFDSSVDALLGYQMKDNSADMMRGRVLSCCLTRDPAALQEAEKALGKYPNSFRIVYACAKLYLAYGCSSHDRPQLRRALELMEKSRLLLSQNDDPRVSDATICGEMATACFLLDEQEKCLDLLKKNNAGGQFSCQIGVFLSLFMDRAEEAAPYLSESLVDCMSDLVSLVAGFVFLYCARNDWASAIDIARWGLDFLDGLKKGLGPDYLDKTHAELLALLACVQAKAGLSDASGKSLEEAAGLARCFDSTPDYSLKAMRFAEHTEQTAVFDLLGATASEGAARLIGLLGDAEMSARWKEAVDHA